ncbi:MAG TPA: SDR family NAD(P)-dependent oxidoreductase [Prosthecochloris aestuarii]|uniref:SDR family NAD(P)-dependent oxidoreductase n=1 Tax=Prosthecochloris aestuarii TaxID=1102 RepID=A0A831STA9_PROAE|nr:SDR family NAD(P)-dependent oxidoreductase [Prosthecochloris sp.]HED30658.1 SDR family NAD(P)-dependent oxidoreductase [Prosthecochloris aestuarii]
MGIGRSFALEYAQRGCDLVLTSRSEELLERLASEIRSTGRVDVQVCPADLSSPEGPEMVFGFCQDKGVRVTGLVHCAGFGYAGSFHSMPENVVREMVFVNMFAVTELTRLFLPDMIQQRRGSVITVASMAGLQGVAGLSLYAATKSFLLTFSEALHAEYSGKGIRALVVCPGYIMTSFHRRAGQDPSRSLLPVSAPEVVVRAVFRGLRHNRVRVYPCASDYMLAFLQRFTPRKLVLKIAARLAPL